MYKENRYQRHSEFISPHDQQKLHQARVLIAGYGVGSHVVSHLARLGIGTIGEIIITDPGLVEIGNLNRQENLQDIVGTLVHKSLKVKYDSIVKLT